MERLRQPAATRQIVTLKPRSDETSPYFQTPESAPPHQHHNHKYLLQHHDRGELLHTHQAPLLLHEPRGLVNSRLEYQHPHLKLRFRPVGSQVCHRSLCSTHNQRMRLLPVNQDHLSRPTSPPSANRQCKVPRAENAPSQSETENLSRVPRTGRRQKTRS